MNKLPSWKHGMVLLGIVLAGCSSSSDNTTLPKVGDVTITAPNSASVTMQTGQELQLAATVSGDDSAIIGWTVRLDNTVVPNGVTNNVFTAPATTPASGSATYIIEAYNVADATKNDFVTVTVQNSRTNSVDGATLVWVPAGQFQMGRNSDDTTRAYNPYRENSESPEHPVKLSGYWMYKHEVTIGQYRQFANANPGYWREAMNGADNLPVANVKHSEAAAYAQWAGGALPTEAQWEKAARGTENRAYPWGSTWVNNYCTLWQNTPAPTAPLAVGSKSFDKSQYDVMDLGGNLSEWCKENYGDYPASTTLVTDPDGSANTGIDSHLFAVRGGSWTNSNNSLSTSGRTAERSAGGDGTQVGTTGYNDGIGFRCVIN